VTLGALLDVLAGVWPALEPVFEPAGRAGGEERARGVEALVYDSRAAVPGAVFVAMRGQVADGASFAADAAARGAIAVVSESACPAGIGVPWITVRDARKALAAAAAAYYGDPSLALTVIGITGTNGKTTTAYLLHAILAAAGLRAGLIGTIAYDLGDDVIEASRTTPESADLQRFLRRMADAGCRAAAMEVSSHALALSRVDGIRFSAAVFTNLTRDHLDFHRDMETYFAAKRRLFEMLPGDGVGIVNADDARADAVAAAAPRAVTFAIERQADVRPREAVREALNGLRLEVSTPAGPVMIDSPLVGRPFAYNLLAAVATGVALGLPVSAIERGIAGVKGVPGRFQVVSEPQDDITVIVDYAHTDDALRNLLETARPLATRRLVTVFGCGGERDRTKRPLMGAVAARLSDVVVITSDNPRGEAPEAIIDEVRRGVGSVPCLCLVDRRSAIDEAIRLALPGDMVLVAGKGHERYQVIGTRRVPFDDHDVVQAALVRRRGPDRNGRAMARKAG